MSENAPTSPSRIKNRRLLALLIVLLISLTIGQWLLRRAVTAFPQGDPPWLVVLAVLLGVTALFAAHEKRAAPEDDSLSPVLRAVVLSFAWVPFVARHWRLSSLILAAGLIGYVLARLPRITFWDSYGGVTLAWMAAFVFYVVAVAPRPRPRWHISAWWQQRRLILAVAAIVLVALCLRAWQIGTIPWTLGGDEGSQGLEAVRVIEGQIRNPFATGWLGVPTMSFFFNSLSIRMMGQTTAALRLPWALLGTATVLAAFFLVRQLKDSRLALVTAALLATYHYHIHFSRLGSNQIADPFFLTLALLFLFRALDRESRLDWTLAGAVSGLAFYFYAGARLTPIVLLAVLAYYFIRGPRQFWQRHGPGLLVGIGAFLIVAAPMMQYAWRFPDDFNARLNQVGIFQSGWLAREVALRSESTAAILFDQFRRAALAFNYYPDRTVWYGLPQPLLDPFFGSLFLLGLGYSTLRLLGRTADLRLAPMVAWWWGGMMLGGMMTESPPSSQRLITLAVPVCFFIALALWELIQLAHQALHGLPVRALLAAGVVLFAVVSLKTYFLDFTPKRLYGGPHAELATEIAPVLQEMSADHRFYFVGAPWMYWGFATLPYLVQEADFVEVDTTMTEPIAAEILPEDKAAVFIFLPQRLQELEMVQATRPQGERMEFYSPVDGRLMVTLYKTSGR